MVLALLAAATAAVVVFTVLPFSKSKRWWIRDLDFPRLQLTALIAVVLALDVLLLRGDREALIGLAAPAALCLAYQARWILPYTRLRRKTVPAAADGASLRVMVANVLTTNRRAEEFLRLVREVDPDVVVTLESDGWWETRLDALQGDYPHALKCPLANFYGMHLYSKLPLEHGEIRFLVQGDVPSIHADARLRDGRLVEMHFLHPKPPTPETKGSKPRDVELMVVAKGLSRDRPTLVAGDLNDVAWSRGTRRFLKASELLDPRVGRGMFNTFHAGYWFARWPLDHFFHSRHFALKKIERLPAFGSDHFPVMIELALPA